MKKVLAIIICSIIVFSLTSCVFSLVSDTSEDAPKKETQENSSTVSVQEEKNEKFGLNETAVFNDLKFTATELKESDGKDFFEPKEGNIFVGVKFVIENISEEEQSVSSLLLFDAYSDNIKADLSFNASGAFDEGTLDGTIAPGKKLVGWYAMELPENWSEIELVVHANWLSNRSAQFVFSK